MSKNSHQTLTEKFLSFLADTITTPIEAAEAFLNTPYCYTPKRNIKPFFASLQKSGYIKKEKRGFKLTKKGKIKNWYTKWKLIKIDIKNWDGKWRILFFDVPEKKKRLREKLRRKLIMYQFIRLQDSVWITPLAIEKEMEMLSQILEIKYFIRYVITDQINFDADLKKKFFNR
ncbi:MAG: CRISPR-associated endonuclease Cas2 [Patescibacteria group bacterium]